jgi:o-succinylbenzoate synthase
MPERDVSVAIRSVELREVALPLVRPFRTSFGEESEKRCVLLRIEAGGHVGWGECAADVEPRYSGEWNAAVWDALTTFLVPSLLAGGPVTAPEQVAERTAWVRGLPMAKAALEMAVLDVWLRAGETSLAAHMGAVADRVPCGVSVGIAASAEAMLEEIHGYLEKGYGRVKLKIEPGRDLAVVRAVREALPDVPLSVDANAAYTPADTPLFEALDELGLVMIEQPLGHDDLADHARLQARLRTDICLDESIRHAHDAAAAIEMGACRVINIKPGRVGGLLEARRVHDVARERGVPVWIGGMLETGIGRATNVAMAALPGVTMPGDTSASDRYFHRDLTPPFVLEEGGTMRVPTGPGIGVEPVPEALEACTLRTQAVQVENV